MMLDSHNAPIADEDTRLMLAFQNGDEESFVILYNKYRDRIVNFSRRFLSDPDQFEDAAQDVFLKLYKTKHSYKPKARFSTFLFRIATNHCLNIQAKKEAILTDRSTELTERHNLSAKSNIENLEHRVQRLQIKSLLTQAMQNLSNNQRIALVLCHYEGMSYREVSLVLNLTESAVKSLLHRAREKLSQELSSINQTESLSHAML